MVPFNVGDRPPERSHGLLVSGNYFSALGLRARLGRFRARTKRIGPAAPGRVISHRHWQTGFSGAPTVLGHTLRVNDRQLTVIGVSPAFERFSEGTVTMLAFDLGCRRRWRRSTLAVRAKLDDRGQRLLRRRAAGARATRTAAQTRSTLCDAAARPRLSGDQQGAACAGAAVLAGAARTAAVLVKALAILRGRDHAASHLLAVCGNTANLMLARASARYREVGVRLTLGAGPWRVASLLLTENLLLALLGAGSSRTWL